MSAFSRTAPTLAGASLLTLATTAPHTARQHPSASSITVEREADRYHRFWTSYDANPDSATAWTDAVTTAWHKPQRTSTTIESVSVDRWNNEGGSDPD
ncbi:hypothetical protein HQQ81_08695 [Microbacteriaceae bacterium VKM Ac-2854]|nr:hypothetical protein [Microbacteriaceae bacterium VKM Ac-2854]